MLHRGKTSSNGTQEPNGSPTPAIHDERHTTPVMTRKPAATRPCCSAASPAADPSCCRSGFRRELLIWAPSNGVGLTSVAVQRSAGLLLRRSEERRVGKGCGSTCRFQGARQK